AATRLFSWMESGRAHVTRAQTAIPVSNRTSFLRSAPSSASRSCAVRCHRFTDRLRGAAWVTFSRSRTRMYGPVPLPLSARLRSAIERIEVVRGPMSSLYGSDAMGGVINIITRKVADVWSGSVTVDGTLQQHSEYGNSGQVSFYGSGPLIQDKLGLQIWGRG